MHLVRRQVLRLLGKAANQPVDAVDYAAPGTIRAATALVFLLAGLSVAAALNLGLGDATWAVSSGLGACLASAVYELGRPQRLSVEEGMALEEAYRTFGAHTHGWPLLPQPPHASECCALTESEPLAHS